MSGATKLSRDMATLINNRQGSDIQFKIGGGATSIIQENGESVNNESATVTIYAHSLILRCRSRYFATMLDEERNWRESTKGVIYKPNISASTFQDVLHYIYTGNIRASENIIELIAAANEMDLEELSIGCQNELIRGIENVFSDEYNNDSESESIGETTEESANHRVPIDVAIRTHIIPTLNLANSHSLPHLFQKLLTVMLPNMSIITKSPNAYTTFINYISSDALTKIIASDNLAIPERDVWGLALDWACYQTNLSKNAVEARLARPDDDDKDDNEESSDGTVISGTDLNELKETLAPLLPVIRFSLLDSKEYTLMFDGLNYLLPRRRFSELSRYFITGDRTRQLDVPREGIVSSKILIEPMAWWFLKKKIFETGDITGCPSFRDLKLDLLYRASEHKFLAKTFHQLCDNRGPTLTLVRSADGHLFGGVNFLHWKSDGNTSSSSFNFLFAFPDELYRKKTSVFHRKAGSPASCNNNINNGPWFMLDLCIADSSNTNQNSYSCLPACYNGKGASHSALAGAKNFTVSDYEVFAIFKKI